MTEKLKVQTGKRRTEGCVYSFLETPLLVNTQEHSSLSFSKLHTGGLHCTYFLQPLIIAFRLNPLCTSHTPAGPVP